MRQVSVFKDFSDEELHILATVFRVRRYSPGAILCKQGDAYASLFVLVAGVVRAYQEIMPGRNLELGKSDAFAILGQKSLIDGARRWETIEALSDAVVLECLRDDFLRLFRANSVLAYKVLDFVITDLSNRLRQFDLVIEKMLSTPHKSLGSVLDALSEAGGALGGGTRA
ncbi:MAG: cyclic nucleotide-binding domain-containing protein [Pseudomonadota bacterium]